MRLYSIQSPAVYDLLYREGIFHSRPLAFAHSTLLDFSEDFKFSLAYEWMMAKMVERGLQRPGPDIYPIWSYYQWGGAAKPKPDLRYSGLKAWGGAARRVLMTFEIPANQVLLSDYDGWLSCLTYTYCGTSREFDAFYRRCEAQGGGPGWNQPLAGPWHQELTRGWGRVSDLGTSRPLAGTNMANHVIQATCWSVTVDQLVDAVAFGHGRPRERLPIFKPQ